MQRKNFQMHWFTFPQSYLNLTTHFLKWLIMWIVKYSNCVPTTTSYIFIQHQDFAKNHAINKELFWKDMIHTNINGLRQLARDFIKHERFLKFLKLLFKLIFFHMHKESFWKFSLDGLGKIWIEFLFLCCLSIHDLLLSSLLILFL